MVKGLILLPNALDPTLDSSGFLTPVLSDVVPLLTGIIAESEKGARTFLKRFTFEEPKTFRDVPIHLLNEHSSPDDLQNLIKILKNGESWGLISDCGLPVMADPGAQLVRLARQENIPVQAYPGPSSIVLALMLSGLSGQAFTFHGYLPREPKPLKNKVGLIEKLKGQSHIFIEAPYRTEKLLSVLLDELSGEMTLCVAWNLTLPDQEVIVKKVKEWKKELLPDLKKKPAVFVVGAP